MPLFVDEKRMRKLPGSLKELWESFPQLQKASISLRSKESVVVGPRRLVYVGQREIAGTVPDDDVISILGSDDATTCHIAILRNESSGAVSVAHFDGADTRKGCEKMVKIVHELSKGKPLGRLKLHLAGGFLDEKNISKMLSFELLDYNDVMKNGNHWPVIYGIGVDVKTGSIFPARFLNKGPDMPLRSARIHTHSGIMDVYDNKAHKFMIKPFTYSVRPDIVLMCQLPDSYIRQNFSTSPEQEPPGFESSMRASFQFVRDNPDPLVTVFARRQPLVYTKETDGSWTLGGL